MTAEERLIKILNPLSGCPICDGTGDDPIQRSHRGEEPAKCRRCGGDGKISRLDEHMVDGVPDPEIILKEEVRPNGALVTHYQSLKIFADKHREVLERSVSGLTNIKRLQEISRGADPALKGCIEGWLAEGRK